MKNSQIFTRFNTKVHSKRLRKNFSSNTKQIQFLDNLDKVQDFVKSESWKKMHEKESGHDIAYSYFKETFKGHKVLFYDEKSTKENKVTHDDTNFFCKLTEEQKTFIIKIDKNKKEGIFKCKNIFVMHIGSTAVIGSGKLGTTDLGKGILTGWSQMMGGIGTSWGDFMEEIDESWDSFIEATNKEWKVFINEKEDNWKDFSSDTDQYFLSKWSPIVSDTFKLWEEEFNGLLTDGFIDDNGDYIGNWDQKFDLLTNKTIDDTTNEYIGLWCRQYKSKIDGWEGNFESLWFNWNQLYTDGIWDYQTLSIKATIGWDDFSNEVTIGWTDFINVVDDNWKIFINDSNDNWKEMIGNMETNWSIMIDSFKNNLEPIFSIDDPIDIPKPPKPF